MSIKCEVVFDGDSIYCGKKLIVVTLEGCFRIDGEDSIFIDLEQAIKYCMEQSK